MTAEQLTAILKALEAARDTLQQPLQGTAFEKDRLDTLAKVEKGLIELDEALVDPDADFQLCDRCKKVLPYNGDWYFGLCPGCADKTYASEEM